MSRGAGGQIARGTVQGGDGAPRGEAQPSGVASTPRVGPQQRQGLLARREAKLPDRTCAGAQVVVQEAERQLSGLSTDLDRVRWQQAALGTRLGTSSAVGAAAKPGALLAGYEHSRGGRGGAGGSPASASKGGGLGASPRGPRGAPPWGSRPGSAVAAGGGGGGAARAGAGHAHYTFGRLQ